MDFFAEVFDFLCPFPKKSVSTDLDPSRHWDTAELNAGSLSQRSLAGIKPVNKTLIFLRWRTGSFGAGTENCFLLSEPSH